MEELSKEEMLEAILDNTRQKVELLQNASPEIIRFVYNTSNKDLMGVREHLNRESRQNQFIRYENGTS